MINPSDIASHYRDAGARGSHPVSLVVKLYAAILEDFRRAMNAVADGDIQARTASLNHALLIIAELQSVLDHARGKQVARHLNGFYDVTRTLIIEANLYPDRQHLQRLVDLYLPLYHAWQQVEQDAHTGKLQLGDDASHFQRPEATPIVPANLPSEENDSDAPRVRWNA